MIDDKRMKFVKSEKEINYYLFKPSVFSLYYNDGIFNHDEEPAHRYSFFHKLHMMWYIMSIRGGYRILYLEQDGEILSYIIFVKANRKIIQNCEMDDYYTIFLWTYPEHRGKGLATLMAKTMLNDLSLDYNRFYKTINKNNVSSIRVAEKCGFHFECDCMKTRWLHTINKVSDGDESLYCYTADCKVSNCEKYHYTGESKRRSL